jgi:hypothetical protein
VSTSVRRAIATSAHIIYRTPQQRDDIVSVTGVRTELVAFLRSMIDAGAVLEVTALMSDHHNDLELNPVQPHCGTHAGGWAIDCWPLWRAEEGAYLDAQDPRFATFLRWAGQSPYLMQIGLAGSAWTPENLAAAGEVAFQDEGNDHVHFGVHT